MDDLHHDQMRTDNATRALCWKAWGVRVRVIQPDWHIKVLVCQVTVREGETEHFVTLRDAACDLRFAPSIMASPLAMMQVADQLADMVEEILSLAKPYRKKKKA